MFYLMTHSTHFIKDQKILKEETIYNHLMDFSFRVAAKDIIVIHKFQITGLNEK